MEFQTALQTWKINSKNDSRVIFAKFLKSNWIWQNHITIPKNAEKQQIQSKIAVSHSKTTIKEKPKKTQYGSVSHTTYVKTNIGKKFFQSSNGASPKHHLFLKIINKNNDKLSYCCTINMLRGISAHLKGCYKNYFPNLLELWLFRQLTLKT